MYKKVWLDVKSLKSSAAWGESFSPEKQIGLCIDESNSSIQYMVQYILFILGQFLFVEPMLWPKPDDDADDDDDDDDDGGNDYFLYILACIFDTWFSQVGWVTFCRRALSGSF